MISKAYSTQLEKPLPIQINQNDAITPSQNEGREIRKEIATKPQEFDHILLISIKEVTDKKKGKQKKKI
uniref:Uncharacterized protein n=1 Tax=Rhizophora mucronata TaxID=61149 RepID=A0A2P2Q5T7_RHIMU